MKNHHENILERTVYNLELTCCWNDKILTYLISVIFHFVTFPFSFCFAYFCVINSYVVPPIEPEKHRIAPRISNQFSLAGSMFLINVYCNITKITRLRDCRRFVSAADKVFRTNGEIMELTAIDMQCPSSDIMQRSSDGKTGSSIISIRINEIAVPATEHHIFIANGSASTT